MKKFILLILCLIMGVVASAQSLSVRGVVVDEKGEPIAGASVMISGTTRGVSTGADGSFQITAPDPLSTVDVSFLGYLKATVPVSAQMRIQMEPDTQFIEEVVVTGMTTVDRRLFTGAADMISNEKVKLDGIADISRALEGRSAGVSVQNVSGTFGTAPKIRVRGATSIHGSSRPLWVVDGVIMEDAVDVSADELSSGDAVTLISSAVAGLNPDDIESFQILKDGSATSIYGARAMAGVVVITTKRGKAGVSTINYTGEFSTRLIPSYNQFNIMNSQDQMSVYQEMYDKGFLQFADTYRAASSGVYGRMYALINAYDETSGQWGLPNTPEARNLYLQQAEMRNTDWFNKLFNMSVVQNHSVSISSGTEKARFYTSMSFMDDPGWTKSSKVNRYTLNVNAQYDVRHNITFTLLGAGSYRKQKAPGTLNQEIDPVYGSVRRDFDINPYSYALNTSRTMSADEFYIRNYAPFNILYELENNYINLSIADLRFQGELKWTIIPGLSVSALAATKYSVTNQDHNILDYSNMALTYRAMDDATIRDRNYWLYTNPDVINSLPESILPEGGILDKRVYKMSSNDFRATVDFNRTFNSEHIINFFAGMELNDTRRNQSYNRGWGYQYDKGGVPFYTYLAFKKGLEESTLYYSNIDTHRKNVAFFANGTYSWRHKYSLNGTIRYEGSNRLGRSRSARWLPTWNISGAWNIHEEDFFDGIRNVMSHLKFRVSYSLTGDVGPFDVTNSMLILENYTPWRPSADEQESGIRIVDLANDDLTYEKKHELNFGLDMGFLENRLNFSLDVYRRNNFDLIGLAYTQGAGGQISKYANVATMKSHGVEFTVSTRNIETSDFNWNTDFTFSWAKNEITKLESNARVIDMLMGYGIPMEGYPNRGLFSLQFKGLNEDGIPQFINERGELTTTDINMQETREKGHLKYEGPIDPTITGGFGNTFSYKNFRLNIFMTYSFGNKIRLNPIFSSKYTDMTAMPKEFKNRWVVPGDEFKTSVPVIASARQANDSDLAKAYNAYNYSDARVADGGFIRMKEISLTYDFGKDILEKMKINRLQLKVVATNPFLIYADSKLNGQDPEFFQSGGVAVPMARQFTLTVRIGF